MQKENIFKSYLIIFNGISAKQHTVDINNEILNWLKIVWLRSDDNFGVINFNDSPEEDEPFRCIDLR